MPRYLKRNWDECRGDEFDNWGKSVWYFEIDDKGYPMKQIEKYENAKTLKYDLKNKEDKYGCLGDQVIDFNEFVEFEISKEEFRKAWSENLFE